MQMIVMITIIGRRKMETIGIGKLKSYPTGTIIEAPVDDIFVLIQKGATLEAVQDDFGLTKVEIDQIAALYRTTHP
jgi:hypothetical protein